MRGLAEVGWGVFLFTFCCPRSLGWAAGEAGTGAVRGREAHSPGAPAPPHVPAPSPSLHSVRQPWQLIQEWSPPIAPHQVLGDGEGGRAPPLTGLGFQEGAGRVGGTQGRGQRGLG